ncbi:chymotrypsin-like protease CTRL-1 [Daphnia carinata]|uniref:chymotrypsin-like protease CTRL-1 n=1 Tax=Daphnia carinata TaxID=120202 RepID=UPI0028683BBE|nr:chymotrypsin-like protease CTRL-1 [Daphnia carinata]
MTPARVLHSMSSTIVILLLASVLSRRSAVTASIYQTSDAIVIEAGDVAEDEGAYQNYLLSNSFMKEKERSCFTRDGRFGSCTTIRTCYPNIKLPQLRHLGPLTTAIRGTCNYVEEGEKMVYGVCCSKQLDGYDYDELGHPFYQPFSTVPANMDDGPDDGPAYGSNFAWLLNAPHGQAHMKKPNEWIKGFIDSKQSTQCGAGPAKLLSVEDQRVVGGTDAAKNSWPGMAGLRYSGFFFCGASLIAPTKILTAAHCVDWIRDSAIGKLSVHLGMHDKDQNDAQLTKMVSRLVIHKGWNPISLYNDIAMITLDSPVTYTSTISPFCLPAPGLADRYVGSEAAIIGWGDVQQGGPATSVLQQATVQITSNLKCRKAYPLLAYSMLCAAAPGRDTCQGDSGSPLLVRSSSGSPWTVAGIVSHGKGCARPEYPGVYTRVTSFRPWIRFHLLF